jgi:hypothetical protein
MKAENSSERKQCAERIIPAVSTAACPNPKQKEPNESNKSKRTKKETKRRQNKLYESSQNRHLPKPKRSKREQKSQTKPKKRQNESRKIHTKAVSSAAGPNQTPCISIRPTTKYT